MRPEPATEEAEARQEQRREEQAKQQEAEEASASERAQSDVIRQPAVMLEVLVPWTSAAVVPGTVAEERSPDPDGRPGSWPGCERVRATASSSMAPAMDVQVPAAAQLELASSALP